jgi:hypothetical protein
MKKICFLLMLLALSACSKKSTPVPDATVTYHFTGNANASYQLRYSGSDGNPISTTFTGTSWSKTITANKASGFGTYAVFFISLTSPGTVITGSADITVNDKISSQVPLTFNSGDGSTDLTFSAGVFK